MVRTPALAALAVLLLAGPAWAQRFGVVDVNRVVEETEEGKRAYARLKGSLDAKQRSYDQKLEEVKRLKAELDKQRVLLKPDAIAQRERELQQKWVEAQEFGMKVQKELLEAQGDFQRQMLGRMRRVVEKIAAAESLEVVLEANTLPYFKPHLDVTNEVIRRFNAGEGGGAPKAPAAKKAPGPAKAP